MSSNPSLASPSAEADSFAFQHSPPLYLRQQPFSSPPAPPLSDTAQGHDYNFSGAAEDEANLEIELEEPLALEATQDVDLLDIDRRISGCSSISSFPASSIAPRLPLPSSRDLYHEGPRTPTRQESFSASHSFERLDGLGHKTGSPRSAREYHSAFRHPSSVRALQMRDEVMSESHSVLRHHRRSGSQMSSYSQRSSYSTSTSPTKRSSRSHRGSPQKPSSNLRKEFPLVLLHCTLLPPTLLPHLSTEDDPILIELLPPEYRKRWDALRGKLVDDLEVKSRGILIPHPREDYELLEERILETLDLENPRIRHNHFFHQDTNNADSGFESGSATDDDVEVNRNITDESKCIDCGSQLHSGTDNRRWEVKVYAANGLMRAGAWGAAWQEMEKVDVEIRVRLPESVRRDLEAKMIDLESSQLPPDISQSDPEVVTIDEESRLDTREREVYGASGRPRSQAEIDGFYNELPHMPIPSQEMPIPSHEEPDLQKLLAQSTQRFLQERKNILVGVLSFLVLFFALAGKNQAEKANQARLPPARQTEILTTTVTTTSVAYSTETITTSISLERPSTQPMPHDKEAETVSINEDAHSFLQSVNTSVTRSASSIGTDTTGDVTLHEISPQSQDR